LGRHKARCVAVRLLMPPVENRTYRRVGSQRVTRITEHFSNNPPPNELMSLSISSRSPVTTDDDQVCVGVPHLAYLTVADHQITCSPSPALPPPGSPGRWLASQRHHITVRLCHAITALPIGYYENSGPLTLSCFRPSHVPLRRNVPARRRCPTHALQYPHGASPITQGIPRAKVELVARDGVGVQTCYRRVCRCTAGHWDADNPALTVSRRRCGTMPYTSSGIARFPSMLLFPSLSASGKMGRLEVICLELRPPPGAILSVRTMAHTFMVYGLAPAVPLRVPTKRSFPFRQLHGAFPADSLRVRWVPLVRSFRRLGAFATSPHPAVRGFPTRRLLCPIRLCWRALAFRWGLPCLLPTRLPIPQAVSRVQHGGLNQDGLGGTFLVAPSTLCGSPVPA
jgi:hypothetical protein